MIRYDKLKAEISEMSLGDFIKSFVAEGTKDYICSEIKVPHAHCMNHQEHNCVDCVTAYLEGNVEE